MALQSSGAISLSQIAGEFGGSTPHSLSEYYRSGGLVTSNNTNIPASGSISFSNFYGAAAFTYTTFYNSSGVWTGVSKTAHSTISSTNGSFSPARNGRGTFVVIGAGGSGAIGKLQIPDLSPRHDGRCNMGGGAGGAVVLKSVSNLSTSQNYSIVVGSGASTTHTVGESGISGGQGGNTTVTGNGLSLTARGGNGGTFSGSFFQGTGVGGTGRTGSGGDVNLTGGNGSGDTSTSISGVSGGAAGGPSAPNNDTNGQGAGSHISLLSNYYGISNIGSGASGYADGQIGGGGGSQSWAMNSPYSYNITNSAKGGNGIVYLIYWD